VRASRGVLGLIASHQLQTECFELLERGVNHVILDLRATDALKPAAIAAIAAVNRHARQLGSRLSIVLGNDDVTSALAHTGLLQQIPVDGLRKPSLTGVADDPSPAAGHSISEASPC
jgi:anti-anti-sigma regulatory factor